MTLDALKEQRMQRIGLPEFLKDNKTHFKAMAAEAYAYTAKILLPAHHVRQADVFAHLDSAIELDPLLEKYLAKKKSPAQYWYALFTDLVIDTLWKELEDEY